jgi:hypothetical protein
MIAALASRSSLQRDESRTPADSWRAREIDVLRTGTLALAAVIAALFMGGASADAAAEAPPASTAVLTVEAFPPVLTASSGMTPPPDVTNADTRISDSDQNWSENGR